MPTKCAIQKNINLNAFFIEEGEKGTVEHETVVVRYIRKENK